VIDSVVSSKELIDTMIREVEAILSKDGNIGRLIR
jgi:hypothetical protein